MAEKEGVTSRAEWKRVRAQAGKEAYEQAYDEVWQIYVKAKDAEINAQTFQTSQEYLDHELQMAEVNTAGLTAAAQYDANQNAVMGSKSLGGGCLGFASLLVVSGSGIVYLILNLI